MQHQSSTPHGEHLGDTEEHAPLFWVVWAARRIRLLHVYLLSAQQLVA
jgi:hypothetical protein